MRNGQYFVNVMKHFFCSEWYLTNVCDKKSTVIVLLNSG